MNSQDLLSKHIATFLDATARSPHAHSTVAAVPRGTSGPSIMQSCPAARPNASWILLVCSVLETHPLDWGACACWVWCHSAWSPCSCLARSASAVCVDSCLASSACAARIASAARSASCLARSASAAQVASHLARSASCLARSASCQARSASAARSASCLARSWPCFRLHSHFAHPTPSSQSAHQTAICLVHEHRPASTATPRQR